MEKVSRAGVSSVFVSHGAPTLVLDPVPSREFLRDLGRSTGRPAAVLCVSAHWDTVVPAVTSSPRPTMIYDFYGFDRSLYEIRYPAPGDAGLARRVVDLLGKVGIEAVENADRGLDHGAWVPLSLMYPEADVPVVQLSVQSHLGPSHHAALGRALRPLRDEGVLVLASGGATHNLGEFRGQRVDAAPPPHVLAFEAWLVEAVTGGRREDLADYAAKAPEALRIHPTPEHFLPLFVAMGSGEREAGRVLHRSFTHSILSMAAFAWD